MTTFFLINTGKRKGFERLGLLPDVSGNALWFFSASVGQAVTVFPTDLPYPPSLPVVWFLRGTLVCFPGDRCGALCFEGIRIFRLCVV